MGTRCDHTLAWAALREAYRASGKAFDLRAAFASDSGRFNAFSQQAPHVFADLSKNLIDAPTEALLLALARQCGGVEAAVAEHELAVDGDHQRRGVGQYHRAAGRRSRDAAPLLVGDALLLVGARRAALRIAELAQILGHHHGVAAERA